MPALLTLIKTLGPKAVPFIATHGGPALQFAFSLIEQRVKQGTATKNEKVVLDLLRMMRRVRA